MDTVAKTVDEELDRLISRRASQDHRPDPDELEPGYMDSVRRFNASRHEENRAAWAAFHQGQAERHRRTLEDLVAHHEEVAAKLLETNEKGSAA